MTDKVKQWWIDDVSGAMYITNNVKRVENFCGAREITQERYDEYVRAQRTQIRRSAVVSGLGGPRVGRP